MTRPLRLGIRTRLLLAVVGAVSLALAFGVVAFNVLLDQRLSDSATSLARAQAVAALSALDVVNGTVVAPGAPAREPGSGALCGFSRAGPSSRSHGLTHL